MGQSAHLGPRVRGAVGPALLGVLALLAAGVVAGCAQPAAKAVTTIVAATDAFVVDADGSSRPARGGDRMPAGAEIRTTEQGAAQLDTRGRATFLGADALYLVSSGVAGVLRRGTAVVDARSGPGLTLDAGTVRVTTKGRTALRVERSFAVRVGTYAGAAELRADTGSLRVDDLHQAIVAGRSLPGSSAPLQLTDDAVENRVVPDLVRDDLALGRTAAQLDHGPEGVTLLQQVSSRRLPTMGSASAGPVSERALPLALARAAGPAGELTARYLRATELRRAGGSWGVVARLLGTTAVGVDAALDALLAGDQQLGPTLAGGAEAGRGNAAGSGRVGGSAGSHGGEPPGTDGGSGGGPGGTPSPSPSPSPTGGVTGPVAGVVGTVIGLLPTPSATSSPSGGPIGVVDPLLGG